MKIAKIFFLILSFLLFISGNFLLAEQKAVEGPVPKEMIQGTSQEEIFDAGTTKGESAATEIKKAALTSIAPPVDFISNIQNQTIEKTVKIEIGVEGAKRVSFYLLRSGSLVPIYLGEASGENNKWSYSWDTTKNPNGSYFLFAEIVNQYGSYKSQKLSVQINNKTERSPESIRREEELKEVDVQIKEKEKKLESQVNQAQQEIVNNVSSVIQEVKKSIPEEERGTKAKLEESQKETKENVQKEIEQIASKATEGSRLEREVEETIKAKEETENKIEEKKKELEDLKKIQAPEVIKEKVEEMQKEKELAIKEYQKQKEELENKIGQKQRELADNKKEREIQKQEVVEKALKPLEAIKEEMGGLGNFSEWQNKIAKVVKERTAKLENEVIESEKSKAELEKEMLKDSDGDGLPDSVEIEIGTDIFNPDSDADGYLDAEEVALKSDPLTPSAGNKIVHQDPRKVSPKQEDIFTVERAEIKVAKETQEQVLRIEGRGLPNTFVTLYIYSSPTVVVTKTDAYGRWVYELYKPLDSGEHEIYVVLTNPKGEITARSEGFNFVKSGASILQLIPEAWAKENNQGMEEIASPYTILKRSFIILTLSIIVLAISISLVVVGFLSRQKEKRFFSSKK